MGAVHGVHLKYVAMSVACGTGAWCMGDVVAPVGGVPPALLRCMLWYSMAVHLLIASLFIWRRGEWIIGKSPLTGQVPLWSLIVWAPFHAPTWLYTAVHTWIGKQNGVPVANEVAPGWWIGGRYGSELGRKWAATIDLTVEFNEGCFGDSTEYLLLPCWDGTPPASDAIETAARLAARSSHRGDVMVHCAHGRGRSTCVMVACLVRAGVHNSWRAAFDAVKLRRKGVKLNSKMKRALDEWEGRFGSRGLDE